MEIDLKIPPTSETQSHNPSHHAAMPICHLDLLDSISVGLAVQTLSGDLTSPINKTCASLHGYTLNELRGMNGSELVAVGQRPEWQEAIYFTKQSESSFAIEIDRLRKDGTTFPALVRLTPVSDGVAVHRLLEVHNLESQNDLTRALNQERRLLITSLQKLPIPLAVLNSDLDRALVYSDAFLDLFHSRADLTDADLDRAFQSIARAVQNGGTNGSWNDVTIPSSQSGFTCDVTTVGRRLDSAGGNEVATVLTLQPLPGVRS
jgi:PAS domain S-box-containing protein